MCLDRFAIHCVTPAAPIFSRKEISVNKNFAQFPAQFFFFTVSFQLLLILSSLQSVESRYCIVPDSSPDFDS